MLGHAVDYVKCIVWINKCVGRKDVLRVDVRSSFVALVRQEWASAQALP